MHVDISAVLSVTIGVITIVSCIWRVAAIEKDIQISIRKIESRQEHYDYMIHSCFEAIKHKSDRLWSEIKELEDEVKKIQDKLSR